MRDVCGEEIARESQPRRVFSAIKGNGRARDQNNVILADCDIIDLSRPLKGIAANKQKTTRSLAAMG